MRNREFIFTAVLCAGLFSSCAREIQPIDNEEHPDYQTIEFRATTEMAKTAISGDGTSKTVQWTKGDVIDILWDGGQTTATASVSGPITTFRASVPDGVPLYASYPAGVGTLSGSELTVGIPSTVSGRFNEVNMLAASINRNSDEATVFHNVASYLKFTVAGDANANKIYISSRHTGDGETPVFTGSWPLTFDENGNVTIGEPTPDKKDITVMIAGDGDYYVPVIPDYVYPDGFSILYYSSNSNTYALEADFDFKLDKAYIANFGVVSSTFSPVKVMKYYVTVNGAGSKSGDDWANAMGKNEFKSVITRWDAYDETDPDSREMAKQKEASLNNATFYIAEGTYDFGEIVSLGFSNHCKRSINFTFDGGYYNNGLKDPAGHPTVFSGGNSHNIFKISRYADFGATDCVFANSKGSSGGDAAIWFDDSHGKLTLTNCILRDNSNTATAAAISIGKGSAHLIGCTFSGNSATYAPAINIDNSKSSVSYKDVIVENCTFDGNYASIEAGAIRCASGGPVTVSNSTFINNTTDTYGAVMVCSGAPATFTGCTFGTENNGNVSTKSGGVARVRTSEVTFDDCTFAYNTGQYGGAISMESSNTPVVTVKDCHFLSCTTPTDGDNQGGAIMQDAGTLTVTGSTFDNCQSKDGGVYAAAGGSASFTNCDFGKTTRNGASAGGGCFFFKNSVAPTFEKCWISAYSWTAAGVRTEGSSHPSFTNCTFNNCTCNTGGAAYLTSTSHPTFTGCTFSNCSVDYRGGAIYSDSTYSDGIVVTGCEFTGCYAPDEGGAVDVRNACTYNFRDCNFHDNYGPWGTIYVGSNSTVNLVGGNMTKNIGKTGASGSYKVGAAIYGGANSKVTCNGVVFDGNEASEGPLYHCGSNNNIKAWFNSCVIRNNHWTTTYGCLFNMPKSKTGVDIAFNNCTFIRNYINSGVSLSSDWQTTWFNLNTFSGTVVFSNSTIWGRTYQGGTSEGVTSKEQNGFIRVSSNDSKTLRLVNCIICNSHSSGKAFTINGSPTISASYCLFSPNVNQSGSATFDGTGNKYTALARGSYFGGYQGFDALATADYVKITSLLGDCASFTKQPTATINTAIQNANSGFYDWLNSIGALGKDCRGKTRNSSANWPGAYDNDAK